MKGCRRDDPRFGLCGLNCGLCPIHHMEKGCPGCGGGEGHQSCAVIKCSLDHGGPASCALCGDYPCGRLAEMAGYDSFLPHRNLLRDLDRAKALGFDAYRAELEEKTALLRVLLETCNDGRRRSFFCTAVNLLPLSDCKAAVDGLRVEGAEDLPLKERAALAADRFRALAEARGVSLRLNRKPKK